MMFEPRVMLVTGAAGFIGANFVRMCLSAYPGVTVISYDKLTYAGNLENLAGLEAFENHHFIQGDIGDAQLVADTLREYHVDTIVHFAAESHVDNSIEGPGVFFETNVMGTYTLIEEARRYWEEVFSLNPSKCRFHHISTDEVFGTLSKDAPAFSECNRYEPNSPYSASKAGSDHVVRAYQHTYNVPVTMSNCSNNYGPYQHAEKLIPVVIQSCLDQQSIPVYGDGSNIRDWLFVKDHCEAIDVILRKGKLGESYNVGGDNEVSNLDLVNQICSLMDQQCPDGAPHACLISFVEDRKGHDWRYAIDHTKLTSELGWSPAASFESALAETISFVLANR